VCLFGLTVAHGFSSANAQTPSEDAHARQLFDNGLTLYREGVYELALKAFLEAYEISKRPQLLWNIASALEHLHRYEESIEYLNRWRIYAPADQQESIKRKLDRLAILKRERERLIQPRTGLSIPALPVAVIASGLLSVGVGTVFGLQSTRARDSLENYCAGSEYPCQANGYDLIKKERRLALGADLCFLGGAAVVTTGVVLWAHKARVSKKRESVRLVPTSRGVEFHGAF